LWLFGAITPQYQNTIIPIPLIHTKFNLLYCKLQEILFKEKRENPVNRALTREVVVDVVDTGYY